MGFKFTEKNRIIVAGAFLCCLAMVLFPEITANASKEAIGLWLNSVVPTLLPFFIMANFLKKTGAVNKISPKAYPLFMAVLSGYPMGAKAAGDYYRDGRIDKNELKDILSYSLVTGPAFLIGAVGMEFLGSHRQGIILAISHYLAALVNRLVFGKGLSKGEQEARPISPMSPMSKNGAKVPAPEQNGYYNFLTDAILDSFRCVAIILAYLILFMIGTDLLQFSGLLTLTKNPGIAVLAKGFLEMTVGCSNLRYLSYDDVIKTTMAAFMVTFGGLSVAGQSMSMLRDCEIGFGWIIKMKLSMGIISGIFAFALSSFVL